MFRRSLGSPTLFAIIWTSLASAIYFSLGVVADHALGLTPAVFLLAGLFFALTAMTYVEGASLHQDRAGASVFARYAFNELVSFIAGWAVLLDFVILIAITSFSATNYMAAFWAPLGYGNKELLVALGIIVYVVVRNIRGFSTTRAKRIAALVVLDLALQVFLIIAGLALFFDLDVLVDPIQLGSRPGMGRLHLRPDDRDGGVHRARVGVGSGGRGGGRTPRPAAAGGQRRRVGDDRLHRSRAGGGDGAARDR